MNVICSMDGKNKNAYNLKGQGLMKVNFSKRECKDEEWTELDQEGVSYQ